MSCKCAQQALWDIYHPGREFTGLHHCKPAIRETDGTATFAVSGVFVPVREKKK